MYSVKARRWVLLGGMGAAYIILTLQLVGVQHKCSTSETSPNSDKNYPLAENNLIRPPPPPPPTPLPTEYAAELQALDELLQPEFSPNTVHYVWCGSRWFEFHHYLSVMSVIRTLRPDHVAFYYEVEPFMDGWAYNSWFMELKQTFPFLMLRKLEPAQKACDGAARPSVSFIHQLLTDHGGMYIHEQTVLASFPMWMRKHSVVNALDETTRTGMLMTQRGLPGNRQLQEVLADRALNISNTHCAQIAEYEKSSADRICVHVPNVFYPKDIWRMEGAFGTLARRVFYGKGEMPVPRNSRKELVPNIIHLIWFGGGEVDVIFYLGVLSMIHVAKVEAIYIHGDGPPSGWRWEKLKHYPQIRLVYRENSKGIYGNKVEAYIAHMSDVLRVDIMLKYGGIYMDTDIIFVKPLDEEIRSYDAVGAYDWVDWHPPFPDVINFGIALGKRGAPFWKKFQESMKWFIDGDWTFNGLRQPYRVMERNPELIKIEPTLQVICYESLCHPTWYPGYHNMSMHHLNSPSIKNWKNDTYCYHWTRPTPFEFVNETNFMKTNTMFTEIGRFVLESAGLLDEWKKLYS